MPRYVDGLPVDTNAGDCMDSARLAGMMRLAGYDVDCSKYLTGLGLGVRHPTAEGMASDWKYFSRDQAICLKAGLVAQGIKEGLGEYVEASGGFAQNYLEDDGNPKIFGGDYCLPHVRAALSARKFNYIERIFLTIDLNLNSWFTQLREPNQLIALCYLAGPNEWLKKYKEITPKWREAIRLYWGPNDTGYNRGEEELAERLIEWLEQY